MVLTYLVTLIGAGIAIYVAMNVWYVIKSKSNLKYKN